MTVKIDKYIIKYKHSKDGRSCEINDCLSHHTIASFDTISEDLNRLLAKMVLDELNTGKYEEELKNDG